MSVKVYLCVHHHDGEDPQLSLSRGGHTVDETTCRDLGEGGKEGERERK
jgi:hypothetical protein